MRKNVILLVWDACRFDYARDHAPTLCNLAEDSLSFEQVVSSATWSLPSHVSLVIGEYPHEHGITSVSDSLEQNPLLETLGDSGYTRYGFSPNSFASSSHGFDIGYDTFEFTQYLSRHDGVNTANYYRAFSESTDSQIRAGASVGARLLRDLTIGSVTDPNLRLGSSLLNLATSGAYQLREQIPLADRLFPPLVKQAGVRPSEVNTSFIESVVRDEAETESPFFVFANYTDTHYPYNPPADIQRELLGAELSRSDITSINEEYAHEWEFMNKKASGSDIPAEKLETVRSLFAGEVRATDRHLSRILDALDRQGIADETVVLVTADHGENLGESDAIDGPRMGHLATISDHVSHVPLVVANPSLDGTTVSERVPLKNLRHVVEAVATGETGSETLADAMRSEHDFVACQATPNGVPEVYDRHPELSEDVLRTEVDESRVALYQDDLKLVDSTHREPVAVRDGAQVSLSAVPEELLQEAESQVDRLAGGKDGSDKAARDRLKQLGYL